MNSIELVVPICLLLLAGCSTTDALEAVGINHDAQILANFEAGHYIKSRGQWYGGIGVSYVECVYEICNERGCANFVCSCIGPCFDRISCDYQSGNDCEVVEERVFSGNAVFDKSPYYEIKNMQSCLERFVRTNGNRLIILQHPEASIILQLKKCEFGFGDGYYILSTSGDIKQLVPLENDIESCFISNRSVSGMTEGELDMELDYLLNDFEGSCVLDCMPDAFADMVNVRREKRLDELYAIVGGDVNE